MDWSVNVMMSQCPVLMSPHLPRDMGASETEVLEVQHWHDYFPR